MERVAVFVDGSNLYGALNDMQVNVDDYSALYRHVFEQAIRDWRQAAHIASDVAVGLLRVYWYAVGNIDE